MKYGIIIALESELGPKFLKKWKKVKDKWATFYKKKNKKDEAVLIFSGVGRVNASIATSYLIQVQKVNIIVNIGSCGANNKKLKKGSVHHISRAKYIDVDNRIFEYEICQIPREKVWFEIDYIKPAGKHLSLGSSESFVGCKNKHKFNISKDVDIIDMEGAGIIQTANKLHFNNLVMVKIVSDSIHSTTDKWRKEIINVHTIMEAFIKKII
ncbi:MAG: hypothetical protein HUJ52_01880 [Malacoplasma sp.]|nr:hypothetical protein [Malacoplasma sp.]